MLAKLSVNTKTHIWWTFWLLSTV